VSRRPKIKSIYTKAALTLVLYYTLSRVVFLSSLASQNVLVTFGGPMVYGAIAGATFLYIFSHEDFFAFAKIIEKKEKQAEKRWLKRLHHHGKSATALAVGTFGGPILGALTAQLLLRAHSNRFRYALVLFSSIPSTFFSMGIAKGLFTIATPW